MINVVLADDHVIVREGLKQLLHEERDIEVTGEASDCAEALELVQRLQPDIVVLDISMPGRGGLDTLKQIQNLSPHPSVIILSMHSAEKYAFRAFQAGAMAYLTKKHAYAELVEAIHTAHSGRKFVSREPAEILATHIGPSSTQAPHEALSDREMEVLLFIGQGYTVGEIAEKLRLSPKTISTYRTRILEKLTLKNNADMVEYVQRNRLDT
ncbi:response regulator [bacterium]|nr:response regulator [bacterium]